MALMGKPDLDVLREIEQRVLWLATRMIDVANRRDLGEVAALSEQGERAVVGEHQNEPGPARDPEDGRERELLIVEAQGGPVDVDARASPNRRAIDEHVQDVRPRPIRARSVPHPPESA